MSLQPPHGSGISDLLINDLFSPYIDFKKAVVAVMIFKALTFYLQILVGAISTIFGMNFGFNPLDRATKKDPL